MKVRKYFVVVLAVLISGSVFVFPSFQDDLAGLSWGFFIAVMMVRPVFEVLQKLGWNNYIEGIRKYVLGVQDDWGREISKKGHWFWDLMQRVDVDLVLNQVKSVPLLAMQWRRELGILAGVFGLAHGAGVFLLRGKTVADVLDPALWNFNSLWGWGLLAAALMLPLIITSNVWSMRWLKKLWKPLQRLSYVAFVAAGVHVFFVENEAGPLVVVGLWLVLWGWAWLVRRNKVRQRVGK